MARDIVQRLFDEQDLVGSDWGLGWVACDYAAQFSAARAACAVINVPVYHRSQRTTPKNSPAFKNASRHMVQFATTLSTPVSPKTACFRSKDLPIQRCYFQAAAVSELVGDGTGRRPRSTGGKTGGIAGAL